MKEFTKCAIESCSIDDSANVTTITEFELSNPNCIYYDKKMLYFGTQTQETSPFVMHFLKNGTYFRVDFAYAENIQFLDAGFYQTNVMYLLYNHNEKAEGGLFLITKNFDEKVPLLSIDAKDESVQKLILSKEEDPEILDGRIIVDKLLNSITITGMDSIRRYHVRLENEKYIPEFLTKKNVEDPIDYIPLNRESLTSWAFDEETTEARIGFYKATDTRCLYHWLFQQSKLGDHFNIGDLEDLCNLLV